MTSGVLLDPERDDPPADGGVPEAARADDDVDVVWRRDVALPAMQRLADVAQATALRLGWL